MTSISAGGDKATKGKSVITAAAKCFKCGFQYLPLQRSNYGKVILPEADHQARNEGDVYYHPFFFFSHIEQ